MKTEPATTRDRIGILGRSLAALGLVAVLGHSQLSQRPPGADYEGQAFTFHRIQEGIYHAVGTGNLTVGCNAAVIVNDEDVLVVDSHISPAAAWALVREIERVTPKPVRYVVNTHFHFDHAHGNQVFRPGVEIIGHEFTREMIATGRSTSGRSYELFVGGLPAQIAAAEERLAGLGDPAERAEQERRLAVQRRHLEATKAVVPRPPSVTLERTLTLHRGGREIRLLFLGRGHTGGDVVVHLPGERVLVTGDLLTEGISYLGDSYPEEWIATLEELKKLQPEVILPGHGQAFRGTEKISHFQEYLRDFWTQVRALHAAGVPPEEAAGRIDLRAHADHYPALTEVGVMPHGVARAYGLLSGTER